MSDQGHRVKLMFIKTLLHTTGLSGEALTEAMLDYMEMDDASLDSSIEFLGRFSLPVRPGEGTSSQPHTGVETSSHADQTIAHRRYCMVPSNKRKATICMETWQFFRKEMRLRINFFQRKETTRKRVALRHTSRLGRMGRDGFVATFMKDYGRAPTAQKIEYATYCSYRALCQTLTESPDPLHDEADMTEVAR
ncbi:hypothetical protein GOP47_0000037 [Adiantum capillus-veneris]|uniref:Uncharacterized protein n=1 Tax=Adiantum capillus-veneris TaxID=13818 RepID=A0A9D4VE59_ADICA|nr:hypothetical protein GOP47_0000037 [Adiantum capillus-veneris]